ncbi:LysR family transcriptional regulator [Actinoplanes sp. NPDC051513]|uniref:LysR family transcriptional regulator n=1 Tax=Actinoplanes sp. NPDC051513 TaxID=3363908 RepID=UPI0037A72B67
MPSSLTATPRQFQEHFAYGFSAVHDEWVELRQLETFAAVARQGGFTRAAEHLRLAQSAVSAQVRALEAELGVPLFTRTTRRVTLTEAGEILLSRHDRIQAELAATRTDLTDLTTVLRGRVTLGATAVLGPFSLPRALVSFHDRYPGVDLSLRSDLIAGLLAALDAGETDLVIGPRHADLATRFVARRLAAEHLVLALPPGHPPVTSLAGLRKEPFVCLPAGSGLHQILVAAARRAGFAPRIPFETHSAASIRDLVSAGLGVAILARSAATAPGPPIAVQAAQPAIPHPPIAVIHRRDRPLSPAARACRHHVMEQAQLAG